jgi:hypothetical protein
MDLLVEVELEEQEASVGLVEELEKVMELVVGLVVEVLGLEEE